MLLRKESAGSGVWFDALYSVISGFSLHGHLIKHPFWDGT
jgi:hypothetical protein